MELKNNTVVNSLGVGGGVVVGSRIPGLELKKSAIQKCQEAQMWKTSTKSYFLQPKDQERGSVATQKLLDKNHSTPTKHLSKQKLHATELNSYSRLLQ